MHVEAHWHDDDTMMVNVWDGPPADGNKYGSGDNYGVSIKVEDAKAEGLGMGLAMLVENVVSKRLNFSTNDLVLVANKALETKFG